jgi:type IV secretory pathway VirB10-like protein
MRCHLLTKNLFCSLLCFGLLSLNGVAFAQVYKSYDADGNVVFSDKPTQDSREVEVTKPNVSDSFEIPPPPPPVESTLETKPEAEPEPEPVTQPIADDDSADTNNDGRVSRREKEDQRKERRKKNREEAEAAEEY